MDINELISDNMGLVYKQLHKFNLAYDDDAFSYAMEALMNAANTFDSKKGYAFSTYASACIYNGISCYLRQLNAKHKLDVVFYEEPIKEGESITHLDMLHGGQTPDDTLLKAELYSRLWLAFDKVYEALPNDSSKEVIQCWRESDFQATQTAISKEVGMSQGQVSRILSAFRYKLKKELEEYVC